MDTLDIENIVMAIRNNEASQKEQAALLESLQTKHAQLLSMLPTLWYVKRYATYGNEEPYIMFAGSKVACIAFVESQDGWLHDFSMAFRTQFQSIKDAQAYIERFYADSVVQCFPRKQHRNQIYARVYRATPLDDNWSEIEALAKELS